MGAQVVSPLRETCVVEEQHEQKGPQDTDRVVGGPTAGTRGVERSQARAGGVQIETEEHECGFVPGLGQAASLTAQPALELGG
jgi:hypothetical protein